jgi:F0F1-type ATP synthase epsilon subunit
MSTLANEFGITDVGLAKRCRAVDVPIPYRGYWARRAAGQTPPRLPLPKYRTRTPTLTAAADSPKPPKEILRDGQEPSVQFHIPADTPERDAAPHDGRNSLDDRISALTLAAATTLADTCPAVRRTAKHKKHPDHAPLQFTPAERSGPIINLNVSKDTLTRALLLADRIVRTAEAMGWQLTDPAPPEPPTAHRQGLEQSVPDPTPTPPIARLLVDGEPITFLIEERYREEPREPTSRELAKEKREYQYHAPRITSIPTGALRIVRIDTTHYWSPRRKSWYDQGGSLVEQKIPKILAAFFYRAREIKAARAECERRQRERAEQERLRKEMEDRRESHSKLRAELERQAGAWHRARFLRRYVRAAARHSQGPRIIERPFLDKPIDFLEWAENYVDQLDPLTAIPRNPDQWPEPTDYVNADEAALKKLLLRVTGFDGRTAQKLDNIKAGEREESLDDDDDD